METGREASAAIRIRPLEREDLKFVHGLDNNANVMRYWFEEPYEAFVELQDLYNKHIHDQSERRFIVDHEGQNVGLVAMTKIVNRHALATGAVFLVFCGLLPKLAALISIMPQSVLGGAAVMMFSSIVISGIQLITKEPLTARNITIVSTALGLGYGIGANGAVIAGLPEAVQLIFGGSGIVPAAILAIVLNIVIPREKKA